MPIKCECGTVIKDKKGLTKHQRLHCRLTSRQTNDANLPCPDCDRLFPKLQSLNQHRRHAHVKNYNHDMQEEASTKRRHEWTIHDDKKLATLELEHRTRPGVISAAAIRLIAVELARTVNSIKSRRKLAAYKKVVRNLDGESSLSDSFSLSSSSSSSSLSFHSSASPAPVSNDNSCDETNDNISIFIPATLFQYQPQRGKDKRNKINNILASDKKLTIPAQEGWGKIYFPIDVDVIKEKQKYLRANACGFDRDTVVAVKKLDSSVLEVLLNTMLYSLTIFHLYLRNIKWS